MKGYIYKYTFPDGKVYIGQTRRDPKRRHKEHIDPITGPCNKGFWYAYQKFHTFQYEILEIVESVNEDNLVYLLNQTESRYILQYNAYNPIFGYNIQPKGDVRTGCDKILRDKIEELFPSVLKSNLTIFDSIWNKIFITKESLTEEEKEILHRECVENVEVFSLPEDFTFDDLKSYRITRNREFYIERSMSDWRGRIKEDTRNEVSSFLYENAFDFVMEAREKDAIVSLDKDGNVLETFYSFNEIAQRFNVPRADNVRNAIKGKQKTAYGFFWKYKKDL